MQKSGLVEADHLETNGEIEFSNEKCFSKITKFKKNFDPKLLLNFKC